MYKAWKLKHLNNVNLFFTWLTTMHLILKKKIHHFKFTALYNQIVSAFSKIPALRWKCIIYALDI